MFSIIWVCTTLFAKGCISLELPERQGAHASVSRLACRRGPDTRRRFGSPEALHPLQYLPRNRLPSLGLLFLILPYCTLCLIHFSFTSASNLIERMIDEFDESNTFHTIERASFALSELFFKLIPTTQPRISTCSTWKFIVATQKRERRRSAVCYLKIFSHLLISRSCSFKSIKTCSFKFNLCSDLIRLLYCILYWTVINNF